MNNSLNPLFSIRPIVSKSKAPVVVVGLPRSGSSFLSNVLCQLDDWYVFDDLYAYQKAEELNITNKYLTPEEIKKFVNFLGWSLRARIKFNDYSFQHDLCWDDVDKMEKCICETFQNQNILWYKVVEEWLTRVALHHNRHNWGYKTPQDFMHMDLLSNLFPGIRFVFLIRDPIKVMASFKNLPSEPGGDGDSRQYHPLAYSLYWKMACEEVTKFMTKEKAPVHIIKFEELVANPDKQAEKLASFLQTKISTKINITNKNTSFKGQKKRNLTPTEIWICQYVAGNYMQKMGYKEQNDYSFRIQDLPEILSISLTFSIYQIQRLFFTGGGNRAKLSVVKYIKNLLGLK